MLPFSEKQVTKQKLWIIRKKLINWYFPFFFDMNRHYTLDELDNSGNYARWKIWKVKKAMITGSLGVGVLTMEGHAEEKINY